jgi:putative redox protein
MAFKEASVSWIGPGLRLVGEASSGPGIVIDHVMEDEDRKQGGPTPMELVLLGLAGCTGMDVISILKKKRQPITDVKVKVRGDRHDEHPRVYTKIHIEFIVKGKGVKPSAVERAIELSETRYCSASAMLAKTAEITTSYQIIEE